MDRQLLYLIELAVLVVLGYVALKSFVAFSFILVATYFVAPKLAFPPGAFETLLTWQYLFGPKERTVHPATGATTQNAVVYDRFSPSGFRFSKQAPMPNLRPGEVLVKVSAASINPVDYKLGDGPFVAHLKPIVGFDVAGTVVKSTVPEFSVGQRVFGEAEYGSLCEYTAVRKELLRPIPDGVSDENAAAIVMAFKTSYEAIVEKAGCKAGARVIVLGGSGGTGSFALQIARHLGMYTVTTCSSRNAEFVKSLGANSVVDYNEYPDFSKAPAVADLAGQWDLILDCVGESSALARAKVCLKPGGSFISIVHSPCMPWESTGSIKAYKFVMRFYADNLATAVEMLQEQTRNPASPHGLKVEIAHTYSLSEYAEAFAQLRSQRTRGKLVFKI